MMPAVTSLLPLLPDGPRLPAADALTGGPAAAPLSGAGAGAGAPDFAGLLDALAAPAPQTASGPIPAGFAPDAPPATDPASPQPLVPGALTGWPGGKNLPEAGTHVPPVLPPAAAGVAAPTVPPALSPLAAPLAAPQVRVAEDGVAAEAPAWPGAALPPAPGHHAHARGLAPRTPTLAPAEEDGPTDTAPAPGDEALLALHADEAAQLAEAQASDSALASAPPPVVAALPLAPVLPDDAAAALPATPPPAPGASSTVALVASGLPLPAPPQPAAAAAARVERLADPSRSALPAAFTAASLRPATPGVGAVDGAPAPAPAPAPAHAPAPEVVAEPSPGSAPGAGAQPEAEVAAAPASSPAAPPAIGTSAATAAPAPSAFAERPASPAAPQIESAIAQVGDIREALRNARPAMTLSHAEFGAVSLRLEQAAPDQWRAVLASRDPGFVPAIHAALAERAVAAAAETSASFSGHSGASQNGAGDQRYGSSPNQGQGSPQPYLGQSGQRDGGAAPDHRRPSTAAALAARRGSEAEDSAASTSGSGGLFA
jgi:hypothetical protein